MLPYGKSWVAGRELNLMDVAIHELGREMLEDRMEEQREAAVLKPVRSPTDKKPPGGRRRERYEPSAGELAAALSSQLRIGSEPLLGPGERTLSLPFGVFAMRVGDPDRDRRWFACAGIRDEL